VSHLRGLPEQTNRKAMDNSARMRGCSMCSPPNQQAALDWPPAFHWGLFSWPAPFCNPKPFLTNRYPQSATAGTGRLLGQSEHQMSGKRADSVEVTLLGQFTRSILLGDNKRLRAFV